MRDAPDVAQLRHRVLLFLDGLFESANGSQFVNGLLNRQ